MDDKKITKLTVTVKVEFEDGTGYKRDFHMDPDRIVTMEQNWPIDPKTMKRKSEVPHLKIEGDYTGASNTPLKNPEDLDHRNFTF